jgi:hypothetical protein
MSDGLKKLVLTIAIVGAIAVGIVAIAGVAARGGGRTPDALVGDIAEKLIGTGGGHHRRGCGVLGMAANAVAQTLNISVQQFQTELANGESVGDVAQAHGMTVDDFKVAVVREAKDETAQMVSDGRMTQVQADDLNQRLSDNLYVVVNFQLASGQKLPCRGFRGPGVGYGGPTPSPVQSAGPGA